VPTRLNRRHLSALEKELGCKLVERHPTGYRLTELGRELQVHAERMEESAAPSSGT
jgi:DNA-binding transcriptional LysR family regulator